MGMPEAIALNDLLWDLAYTILNALFRRLSDEVLVVKDKSKLAAQ